MLRFKFDATWRYVDVYDDEHKIKTINYVDSFDQAKEIAMKIYCEYVKVRGIM